MSRSPMITVSAGLIDRRHQKNMGSSIWVFEALLDWQTDRSGVVLGGRPVKEQEIADRVGLSVRQVQRHIRRLREKGYLESRQTSYGLVVRIVKAKKWFKRDISVPPRDDKNVVSQPSRGDNNVALDPTDMSQTKNTNTRNEYRGRDGANAACAVCSHGTCPHRTYHVARLVAEAQGLTLPSNPGRWLREAKDLRGYSDEQVIGCTRWMIERDGGKWATRNLWPRFVGEDMPVYLRQGSVTSRGPSALDELRRTGQAEVIH